MPCTREVKGELEKGGQASVQREARPQDKESKSVARLQTSFSFYVYFGWEGGEGE